MGVYHDTLTFATAPAARGQGVVVFYRRTDGLKAWKNGGFLANPLTKTPPFFFISITRKPTLACAYFFDKSFFRLFTTKLEPYSTPLKTFT